MKKYYDLYEEKISAIIDWNEGFGSISDAMDHFKTDKIREIDSKEFHRLKGNYCNKSNTINIKKLLVDKLLEIPPRSKSYREAYNLSDSIQVRHNEVQPILNKLVA